MEFDSENSSSPVTENARRLAQSKKVTLKPVHTNIGPENTPEAEVAARYASSAPMGNVRGEVEQEAAHIQPSKGLLDTPTEETKSHITPKLISAGVVGIGVILLILLYQSL